MGRLLPLTVLLSAAIAFGAAEPSEPSAEQIGSVRVYLTPEQARAGAFVQAANFDERMIAVSPMLQTKLRERGVRPFVGDSVAVYIAHDSTGAPVGYAIIGEEIGKYRPLTFLVATNLQLQVTSVAILVYRESRGGEVRRRRFLRQYRGKDGEDPIRINRDIINITGATLSVRALNTGVRKSLLLLEEAFDPQSSVKE